MKYIDSSRIHIERIVNELYDFYKLGALSIPNVLTPFGMNDLVGKILASRKMFKQAPKKEGKVYQEMETFYINDWEDEIILNPDLKESLGMFREEYLSIYQKIAELADFDESRFNSLGIHLYPNGSSGITPHRDYERDRDLISIFVLKGNTPVKVCEDEKKNGTIELDSSPGSLILMRAARKKSEQVSRPIHYLGPVLEERLTLIIRRSIPTKS